MKAIQKKRTLTLGEFIVSTYDVVGKRRARARIRRAINAHLVEFLTPRHFVVS